MGWATASSQQTGRETYNFGCTYNQAGGLEQMTYPSTRQVSSCYDAAGQVANQTIRMLSAIYNWQRKEDPRLPENPTVAVEPFDVKARDWATDAKELQEWWASVRVPNPVKRMWWLTCLLTGARRGSVAALAWPDIDFDKRTVQFPCDEGGQAVHGPAIGQADRTAECVP